MIRSTTKQLALVLAILGGFGGLTGCGSGSEAPEGPTFDTSTIDACVLFPVREALSYGEGSVSTMSSTLEDASDRNPMVCSYNAGTSSKPRLFKLEIRAAASAKAADRQIEASRNFLKRLTNGEIQDVPGLGQKALWAGGELQQLQVQEGNLILVATAQTVNAPRSLYIAKLIAKNALARLPPKTE